MFREKKAFLATKKTPIILLVCGKISTMAGPTGRLMNFNFREMPHFVSDKKSEPVRVLVPLSKTWRDRRDGL